jgi:hypothetical protein
MRIFSSLYLSATRANCQKLTHFFYQANLKPMSEDFTKFRELLEANHQFPGPYLHKFIGKNSPIFNAAVKDFESQFIGLKRVGEKLSASSAHLSLTYEYLAASAEDVVQLAIATYKIGDVIYIL